LFCLAPQSFKEGVLRSNEHAAPRRIRPHSVNVAAPENLDPLPTWTVCALIVCLAAAKSFETFSNAVGKPALADLCRTFIK
jgi:hypothetical protein